jgi:hypothetical protein
MKMTRKTLFLDGVRRGGKLNGRDYVIGKLGDAMVRILN